MRNQKQEKGIDKAELKICFWNVVGLQNKCEKTWEYLDGFDVLGLTETVDGGRRRREHERKNERRNCNVISNCSAISKNLQETSFRELNHQVVKLKIK